MQFLYFKIQAFQTPNVLSAIKNAKAIEFRNYLRVLDRHINVF